MIKKILLSVVLVSIAALCLCFSNAVVGEKNSNAGKLAVWGFAYMDHQSRSMCKYLKNDFPEVAEKIAGISVITLKTTDKLVDDIEIAQISPPKSLEFAKKVGADVSIWGMVSETSSSLYDVRCFIMNTKTEEVKYEQLQVPKKHSERVKAVKELIEIASKMLGSAAQKKMDIALNFFNSKQYSDAKDAFLDVIELNPGEVSAYSYLAYIASVESDYDSAINYYQQALEKDPEYTEALEGLAWAYKNNKDFERACETYRQLTEKNPGEIQYLLNIGEIWKNLGNNDAALEAYRQVLDIDDANLKAHSEVGILLFERDAYDEAIPYLKFVVAEGSVGREVAKKLAISYQKTERLDECISQNKKLIEKDSTLASPYLNLAAVYVTQKDFAKAISSLQEYIELRPNSATGYMRIADVYRQDKNYQKAIADAQKAAEISPDDPGPFMILAEIDNSRGYNHYEQFIENDKKAREANQETYDKYDKLRSENKKKAYNYFLSAKKYYHKALSLSTDFFVKEKLKKKLKKTNELLKETKPGFFDG